MQIQNQITIMKDQKYAQVNELELNEIKVYTADKSYITDNLKEETLASVLGRIKIDKELESLVNRIRTEQICELQQILYHLFNFFLVK